MIRYLFGSQLDEHCDLSSAMFRDRTAQFRDRMGWDVIVDPLGWETDEFDALDPLYVIAEDATGGHAGSLRFLPTTGPTMLRDVFPHLTGGRAIRDRLIWECTLAGGERTGAGHGVVPCRRRFRLSDGAHLSAPRLAARSLEKCRWHLRRDMDVLGSDARPALRGDRHFRASLARLVRGATGRRRAPSRPRLRL